MVTIIVMYMYNIIWFVFIGKYRIVQNFDGGNFDVFVAFQLDRQNLTHQIV